MRDLIIIISVLVICIAATSIANRFQPKTNEISCYLGEGTTLTLRSDATYMLGNDCKVIKQHFKDGPVQDN